MSTDRTSQHDSPEASDDKRARLRALLEQRASRERTYPLSFAQQRLWFLEQLYPGTALYNIGGLVRLHGVLDVAAMERALSFMVRRHEALRTVFPAADGMPVQVLRPPVDIALPILDASGMAPADVAHRASGIVNEPFDLATGPLLRAGLVRVAADEHILALSVHHIIFDAWSMDIFVRELGAAYASFVRGGVPELPPLPVRYVDFAEWQRRWLADPGALERELAFWRDKLAGAPDALDLSTDRPRSGADTADGARVLFRIPPTVCAAVDALGRAEGATRFMVLLAAFKALLLRYTGQADLVVGTNLANRNRPEVEHVIGFFTNTLPIRTDLSGDPRFIDVLHRVRQETVDACAHEDLPFEKLVEELAPERVLGLSPLVQVMFVLHGGGRRAIELPELRGEIEVPESGTSKFDITLLIEELPGGALEGMLEYRTALFEHDTVDRMAGHYRTLLDTAVSHPERRVRELPLLSRDERDNMLGAWNATLADRPPALLHQLFAAQAAQTPDRMAVCCDDRALTYRELDTRANQLAHRLRRLGVGPEVPVGLCMERSLEMVVGLLGILKAGGAYVPLDPTYPRDRLSFMFRDPGATVLVTQDGLTARLSLDDVPHHVILDRAWSSITDEPDEPPASAVCPANLAYIIYTSGSTGKPKGAALAHEGLANLLRWQMADSRVGASGATVQLAPVSFDVHFQEMFATWCAGGTLHLIDEDTRRDPHALVRFLSKHWIERLFLPFVALQQLAEAALEHPEHPLRLVEIVPSGEQLRITEGIVRLVEQLGGCVFHNQYGPTESHVVTSYTLGGDPRAWPALPSIGRAIPGCRVYALDDELEPVPVGIAGQLYVAGVGVGRGYVQRPDMTAERYLPDPFSPQPGARMFRSGDLVRWQADGNVEFIGRVDHQVKIRGFRIELGEVEAALGQHPGAREVAVMARDDGRGIKRLVGYVIPQAGWTPSERELRSFLGERLPEYMVPSAYVFMDRFPLTPSGKVDRKSLPAPSQRTVADDDKHLAPRTPTEQLIAQIYEDVLGVEGIGADDGFFDLGGHSLLATQVVARLRAALEVELPLADIFDSPSVTGLARKVDAVRGAVHPGMPPLRPRGTEGELPLSFAQERLWFIQRLEPASPFYNLPMAVTTRGALDIEALQRSVDELVRRHESLRTVFPERDGVPYQVVHSPAPCALPVLDLSGLHDDERGAELAEAGVREARVAFDLAAGPLVRLCLVRLAPEEHVLFVTMHHIISDGWSLGVFVRELSALYAAFHSGETSPLAEPPLQYGDFAVWQRAWLDGEVLDTELAYWRQQLAGAPGVLELPTDRPRPAARSYSGACHEVALPAHLVDAANTLGRREGTTLFMTLLAAYEVLLRRYSGQDDIVVGTITANRTVVETEELIGAFVNALALRCRLAQELTFRELLRDVRRITMEAYAHQHVPFERVVDALRPQRELSHSPLFQVMFVLQNAPLGELRLPGLALQVAEQETHTAKFDLTLFVREAGGGLVASWEYDTDLFDAATIARMARHFEALLGAFLANPDAPIAQVSLFAGDEEERRQLLLDVNPRVALPAPRTLVEWFEESAARFADRTAVCDVEGRPVLTYRALDMRANQLAWRLRQLGVGPESPVGLCMEREPDLVIALLAVLKAGGCYVPLDPRYPQERLAWLVEDSGVAVVIAKAELAPQVSASGARLVLLDDAEEARAIAGLPEYALGVAMEPDHAAYVIYTSGSTGRPKGCVVEHRNVTALMAASERHYQFGPEDVWTLFHSYAFDVSVWELWGTLLYGGRIVLIPYWVSRSPEEFAAVVRQCGVTVLNQTPSAFRQVMEHLLEHGHSLRAIIFAGEALQMQSLAPWYMNHEDDAPRLVNMYGITETTVHVTYRALVGADTAQGVGSVIGGPLDHLRVYLLDEAMEPVPLRVTGEIYVGGAGVSRGYLRQPTLTAERFVPDPFSGIPGARLYRSGDLARRLPDGSLEYLGRADHQLKVRGFRIEPGEIQAALCAHPRVSEALVVARPDPSGDKRLVAYMVAAEPAPSADELRAFLLERMPDYMVPQAFVPLAAFPLNHHGKIDRAALPAPELIATARPASAEPPRTATEAQLLAIWQDVLGASSFGCEDDFFAVGGHSLMAARVLSRIRSTFGVELPLRRFFEAPTIRSLARDVDGHLGGRLGGHLGGRLGRASGSPGEPMPDELISPLTSGAAHEAMSWMQVRLWFLHHLEPDNPSYNVTLPVVIEGTLDRAALEQSVRLVLARHDVLRTRFPEIDGRPVPTVSAEPALPFHVDDLRPLGPAESAARAAAAIDEEASTPFDLAREPLLRGRLLRLADTSWILVLSLHHIVTDEQSMHVLVRELAAAYEAFRRGATPVLPPVPLQYADYARWQRAHLRGERLESMLAYWRERFTLAPVPLELPTDRPRPPALSGRGALHRFKIPLALVDRLRALGRDTGATPSMMLLAAFAAVLSRYAATTDVVVGVPVSGRDRAELEDLIGFFVNTLPVRIDLGGGPSFRELVGRSKDAVLGAYDHKHVPFEQLVEILQPDRDLGRTPLFQVLFDYHQSSAAPLAMGDLSLGLLDHHNGTAKYELSLAAEELDDRIAAELEYSVDLYDAATVARMADHLITLLARVLEHPGTSLHDLSLLGEAERREVLERWNDTEVTWPLDRCFHHLFEEQVKQRGDALAVACGAEALSYRELNAAANRIAHTLRGAGLGLDHVVGVLGDRSTDFLAAILGVLKAGAAYVPLDPALPQRRLADMIERGRVRALLADEAHHELAAQLAGELPTWQLGELMRSSGPAHDPLPAGAPRSLAYVIFTSGSTGRPKGVMLEHAGMLNHLRAKVHTLGLSERDRVAETATQSFDVSVWQFLAGLLAGGQVVVFPGETAWEPVAVLEGIERHRITVFETVPAHLKLLLEELERRPGAYDLSSLAWMMVNGEALPPELCTRWLGHWPEIPMINAYGPTECSDDVTQLEIRQPPARVAGAMPIDGTLPNLRLYVVDDELEPVPWGVPGELCVAGVGVGRGYVGDPERTAQAFVPDGLSGAAGGRLYRTGDRVRRLADGTLEYLGRNDAQIKIRGVRIEVGEVEALLAAHPGVRDVVVVARATRDGHKQMVAYVVPRPAPAPEVASNLSREATELPGQLASYLADRVAEVMIPSAFVQLEALPLLPNGKIDRRALPAPAEDAQGPQRPYVAPRTPLEATLAAIWAELLHLDRVGVHDSFFELGGHSLVAIQTISRVRRALGLAVPVRALFERPSIASLAAHLAELSRDESRSTLARLPPAEHYELAPYQLPEWYMHELEPESPFYNIGLTTTVLVGDVDLDALARAWQTLVHRHAVLRTRFEHVGGRPVQRIDPPPTITRDDILLDRTSIPADEVRQEMIRLAGERGTMVLDFARGPVAFKVAAYPGKRFQLLFTIHHILWDETSTINLARELGVAYNAHRAGTEPALPELELEYVDWARWVNTALCEGRFEPQRRYWLDTFAELPSPMELPLDRPRPAIQTFHGATVSRWLPARERADIDGFLARHGVTLNMLFLAVLNAQLHRLTGQSDFVVGTPTANRTDPRVEPLLGLFATALPIRCTITPDATFATHLASTRQRLIEALDHQDYPSILAIQELDPAFDPSRNRLFSVMFGTQNNKSRLRDEVRFDGAELEFLGGESTEGEYDDEAFNAEFDTAKFDLTVVIDEFDGAIMVRFNYNSDLFHRTTVRRFIDQYLALLSQVLVDPSRLVRQYEMLSAVEARQLAAVNDTAAPFDPALAIHRCLAAAAARTPDAPALMSTDRRIMPYGRLSEAMDRWAHALRARGVGRSTPVAVLLEPGIDLVVALYAVLRAGGAYVPIHPDDPADRQRAVLARSGAVLLVSSRMLAEQRPLPGAPLVTTEELDAHTPPMEGGHLTDDAGPRDLAYVLFTSGTTGEPKGIEIEHAGLVNLLESTQRDYQLTGDDVVLALTPFHFDASVLDIFWPLARGARVVVPRAEEARDPARILALIAEHGVTTLQAVPLVLRALVQEKHRHADMDISSLRLVICGGAAMDRSLRDAFLDAFGCSLANHYGPTEVTVDASRFDCRQSFEAEVVPIGRPIANTRMYVLDSDLQPVPIGVVGEIYIASPGLARGYVGEPATTAAHFVPDPFSPAAGARLYRTGDLGRYSESGDLCFVGRIGNQVKVRGNRVELEEVERSLADHPEVAACAVLHVHDPSGDDTLVAYVQPRDATARIEAQDESYHVFTLAQRPELIRHAEALHVGSWPAYFAGNEAMRQYWPRLAQDFPHTQYVLVNDRDEVVAAGNAVPISWDGTAANLPDGWDSGLERAFQLAATGTRPDTLMILAGVTADDARGRGLATVILRAFKRLGQALGLARVVVPVRPTGKAARPDLDFATYCSLTRDDGLSVDGWLRSHQRVGGRILGLALTSQRVVGNVADWERWSGRTFPGSGSYALPDTMQPVRISFEEGRGEYFDPSVWVQHFYDDEPEQPGFPVTGRDLARFVGERLPGYMVPTQYRFLPRLPVTTSGKLDVAALRAIPLLGDGVRSVPPQNPLQVELVEIWKQVLEIDAVGVTDDFFEVGGHSLRAVQMLSRIRDAFGVEIKLRELFLERTIEGLDRVLAAALSR